MKGLIYSFFILLIFININLSAQEPGSFEGSPVVNLIPPSPDAAALAKYGLFPVSNYTGTSNVDIPLTNVFGKLHSLPISLSYHVSAQKVDAISSSVGLGWSLNAGGVISRYVKGVPDDEQFGWLDESVPSEDPENLTSESMLANVDLYQGIVEGKFDGEPDLFVFNINGYSGKFTFKKDGSIMLMPYQDIKITPVFSCQGCKIIGWIVQSPDGNIFNFGNINPDINSSQGIEFQRIIGDCSSGEGSFDNYASAWYLTKMKDYNQIEEISLTYTNKGERYESSISQNRTFSTKINTPFSYQNCPACEESTFSTKYLECTQYTIVTGFSRLDRIESPYNSVEFIYNEGERLDLANGFSLNQIDVFKGTEKTKTIQFNYNDTYADDTVILGTSYPQKRYRLFLESIQEFSENTSLPPYHFSYFDDIQLPPRLSPNQDHWGYFNNANNSSLLPSIKGSCLLDENILEGADRFSHSLASMAGMLTKVTFPTGGFTEFVLESNRFNFNSLQVPLDTRFELRSVTSDWYDYETYSYASSRNFEATGEDIEYFTVSKTACAKIFGDLKSSTFGEDIANAYNALVNENGQVIVDNLVNNINHDLTLEPGNYSLITSTDQYHKANIFISFVESEPKSSVIGGGVRVAEVISSAGLPDSELISKKYLYEEKAGGELLSLLGYNYKVYSLIQGGCAIGSGNTGEGLGFPCGSECESYGQSSGNKYPLSLSSGSPVVYPSVKVITNSGGYSEFEYSHVGDIISYNLSNPVITDKSWQRGNLLSEKHYDETGLIRSVTNEYDYRFDKDINNDKGYGISVAWRKSKPLCESPSLIMDALNINGYQNISQWFYLKSSTEIVDGVLSKTDFIYDEELGNHTNVIEKVFTNSDGKVISTQYSYAHEIGNQYLIDKNIVSLPLKTEMRVNGNLVNGTETKYLDNGLHYLPHDFYIYQDGWQHKASVNYNSDANIQSYTDHQCSENNQTFDWTDNLLEAKHWNNWDWSYTYHPNTRQIHTMTDVNGQVSTYLYDEFQRLETATSRSGADLITTTNEYAYLLNTGDPFNPGSPNYVKTTTTLGGLAPRTVEQKIDGLGRPIKTIAHSYSPDQENVTSGHTTYDNAGRPVSVSLPYLGSSSSGGSTTTEYEQSPLGRVKKAINPDGTYIRQEYGANSTSEVSGYAVNELYKQTIWDENNNSTTTFTDKIGQTILVRKSVDGENVDTRYRYDIKGNLERVITPEGEKYIYTYDSKNRVETKAIPGGGTQTFEYDDCDNVTLTTDANGNSTVTTYDNYHRPLTVTVNGQLANTFTYGSDGHGTLLTANSNAVIEPDGSLGSEILTNNFTFDDFQRPQTSSMQYLEGYTVGLLTNDYAADDNLLSSTLGYSGPTYDLTIEGRFKYDHQGRLLKSFQSLENGTEVLHPEILFSQNTYNFRDELVKKSLHSKNGINGFLQNIDYQYNQRGWLTDINGVLMPTGGRISCDGDINVTDTEAEITEEVNCEEFFNLIENGIDFNGEGDCPGEDDEENDEEECERTCTGEESTAQTESLISVREEMVTNQDINNVRLPNQLNLVHLCNGNSFYVLQEELGQIQGYFTVSQQVPVESTKETFQILLDGELTTVSIQQALELRLKRTFTIIGYGCKLVSSKETSTTTEPTKISPEYEKSRISTTSKETEGTTIIKYSTVCSPTSLVCKDGYCRPCIGLQDLDETVRQEQWNSVSSIFENNYIQTSTEITYPSKIYQIRLYDGEKISLFEEELSLLSGTYIKEAAIKVEAANTYYRVVRAEGDHDILPLSEVLNLRNATEPYIDFSKTELKTPCDDVIVTDCTAAEAAEQQTQILAAHEEMISNFSCSNAPVEFVHFVACNGNEYWLTSNLYESISGNTSIIEVVNFYNDQTSVSVTFKPDNDLFAMELNYHERFDNNISSVQQRNGNISQLKWKVKGQAIQSYGFKYDELNRLTGADHQYIYGVEMPGTDGSDGNVPTAPYTQATYDSQNNYNLSGLTYDKDGNILSLRRNGLIPDPSQPECLLFGEIDKLSYSYIPKASGPKRLYQVIDDGNEGGVKNPNNNYAYDANGNLISDSGKGITNITYNHLNLPSTIEFTEGRLIKLWYDAGGMKLKKEISQNGTILSEKLYIGGLEISNEGGQTSKEISHGEGRIVEDVNMEGGLRYEYSLKDHLGNSRVMFSDKNNDGIVQTIDDETTPEVDENEMLQQSHYYPFGMQMTGAFGVTQGVENKYLYNGKELNGNFGLDWSDYGARWYDAGIGRWNSVDPLASEFASWSPYNYVLGNPISLVDPDGRAPSDTDGWVEDSSGNVSWDSEVNSQEDFDGKYSSSSGYSYVSDSDNANSYTLPNGSGKLLLTEWGEYGVEDGVGTVSISMEFLPSESGAEVGWTQTFSSNIPDVTSGAEIRNALPGAEAERLDGFGVQQSADTKQARWFEGYGDVGTPEASMSDMPLRMLNNGATKDVTWSAQSSIIVNNKRAATVKWGFNVTSQTSQTVISPTIVNRPTKFHRKAVKNLIKKNGN